jgi:hypothetical protein
MTSRPVCDVTRVAAIIPALDEEGAIGGVVEALRALRHDDGRPWVDRVVVADNGSRDATAERARSAGAEVVFEPRRGYGSACLAAIAHLHPDPPHAVVFVDGDGSNRMDELPSLLVALQDQAADLVIGSRTRWAEPGSLTVPQRAGNALATFLLNRLYGSRFTDLGPFRAVTWDALERMNMADPDYGWTVEMQLKATKLGLKSVEVDVHHLPRRAGRSKVAGTVRGVVGAGSKILWTIWRYR